MPSLKTRNLFISHAWSYSTHYNKVVEWFNDEPNFVWKNYSVPSHDACSETSRSGLEGCLTRQINPAQGIIILAGMWANYSDWINYEIEEAIRLNKTIIGVRPWGQERTPQRIQDVADTMVNWQGSSIINAVRTWI
ncbi:TIR domain-containing protein [Candidatus Pacearchaeota archaeon]|nr:TIR domain-containing protein [Candidatus Pacearchaeota archaeon]